MSSGDSGGRRRFLELDAFRGIAALWVVLFHYLHRYGALLPRSGAGHSVNFVLFDNGLLPVCWFFIISGFVITWTIERSGTVRDFAVSRFSRLYPVYWTAALLTFTAGLLAPLPFQHYTVGQFAANLTMIQSYFGVPAIDGVYWSLAVELLFYAYMAALLRLGWMRHLPRIALGWATLSFATYLALDLGLHVSWHFEVYSLAQYADFFAAGIAFYQIWTGKARVLPAATLAVCAVTPFLTYGTTGGIICACFLLLFLAAIAGRLGWIVNRVTIWLGAISYSLYVSHEFLGYRIISWLDGCGIAHPVSLGVTILLALCLAAALTRGIEQPAMRLIRRAARRPPARPLAGLSV